MQKLGIRIGCSYELNEIHNLNPEIVFILSYLIFISLADLDRKNIEHQETVNQVKKLTQQFNIQSTPSKKKDKPHTAFFM